MKVIPWNGKPIKKPGWYSGIPLERYHSKGICDGLAVSSSNLRTCARRSLAHMHASWCENPKAEQNKPTRSMILGTAAHHFLLGESKYNLAYATQPLEYRDKTTGKLKPWHNGADFCKAWVAKQEAKGLTVLMPKELLVIQAMSQSLALESIVKDAEILTGLVEHSGFARDPDTGLWLKVRPDVIPTYSGDYVDLKTTSDVTTVALQSTIRNFGYFQQGALIWEVADLLGDPFKSFNLMFVETDVPYCARRIELTMDDLGRGRQLNRLMLREITQAVNEDRWPGPGYGDDRPLPLSNDERERIDRRLKVGGLA